jgi:hypothetical protein
MELHETAWNCMEWHETAWNCMEAWNVFSCSMELHGMRFHAAWNCMDFHAVPCCQHENMDTGYRVKTCCAAVLFISFISNLIIDRF